MIKKTKIFRVRVSLSGALTIRPPKIDHATFLSTLSVCCDTSSSCHFATVTFCPLVILLLQHFFPVIFYYCVTLTPIRYVQISNVRPHSQFDFMSPRKDVHVECDMMFTFASKQNMDILSPGLAQPEPFQLGWKWVDRLSQWSAHQSIGLKRNLDVLAMSPGHTWKCFGLVGGAWTNCHNGKKNKSVGWKKDYLPNITPGGGGGTKDLYMLLGFTHLPLKKIFWKSRETALLSTKMERGYPRT
jgi:hypothetical protein